MSLRNAVFPVVLSLSSVSVAVPAGAQETGGDDPITLEDLEKSIDDATRQFEQRQIEFEKIGAYIGGKEPWPRPDPELDLAVWGDAVLAAERVTAGEVLERSETVKITLAWTERLVELFEDEQDVIGTGVEAVVAAGRHTSPDSEVKLRMVLILSETSYNFSRGGRSTGEEGLHYLQISSSLVLPARVLRAGEVHHVPLVFATSIQTRMWPSMPGRAEVQAEMTAAARKLFDLAAAGSTTAPEGPGVWGPWIGDPARSNPRFDAWNASFRESSRKLGPALGAVPGFREILPWDEGYRSAWVRSLAARGFSAGLLDAPDLRGEMFFDRYTEGDRLRDGGVLVARSRVVERDAVAVLGGRYVRLAGDSFVDVTYPRFTTKEDLDQQTGKIQQIGIGEFLDELGPGGDRAGQVRHEDAVLVARYLEKIQRVPLSQQFIDGVANRIALALASAPGIPEAWRHEWINTYGAEPTLDLARVGSARHAELVPRDVQRAVDRVIDELTLADPLGLYAFDQPWHHDRSRMKNELPEGFAERVQGKRPSGAGALERVYVDTADSAAWDLASSYGQKDRYRIVQGSLRSSFEGQRILVCSYIPSDGDVQTYTQRFFWYGEQPEGWAELVKTLPAEIRMDRIGPPLEQAPSYVTEADELIDRTETR